MLVDNGSNGPGYYPCGDEWDNGLGGAGAVSPIVGPAIRRHHRHGVVVAHPPASNPVYPSAPSRLGAAGLHTSHGLHAGAATVSRGFAGGGFYGGLGGGNFHQFHGSGVSHIGAPVSPGYAVGGGLHGLGGATEVHIGGLVSPSFAGGGFHAGGALGASHIGAPASLGFAGGGGHGIGGRELFRAAARGRTRRHGTSLSAGEYPSSVSHQVLQKSHAIELREVRTPKVAAVPIAGLACVDQTVLLAAGRTDDEAKLYRVIVPRAERKRLGPLIRWKQQMVQRRDRAIVQARPAAQIPYSGLAA